MIVDPRITAVAAQWEPLALQPLRVTLRLASPLGGSEPLHLDGLLAQAMVAHATQGQGLEPSTEPYWQPLPLRCLWRDPQRDLPLWASTSFLPVGLTHADVSTWTRQDMPPALVHRSRRNDVYAPRRTQGPEKRQGVALPTVLADAWTADAIGDMAVIMALLRTFSHVGKKRSQGYGVVATWDIHPIPTFRLTDESGRLRRPVPGRALVDWGAPIAVPESFFSASMLGWTPPYWHLGSMASSIPAGVELPIPPEVLT